MSRRRGYTSERERADRQLLIFCGLPLLVMFFLVLLAIAWLIELVAQ